MLQQYSRSTGRLPSRHWIAANQRFIDVDVTEVVDQYGDPGGSPG